MQGPSLFDFFSALVLILLWTGKSCGLCLIPTRFHEKKANDGSEGDSVLPCKGLLCLIFFALVLILLWTGKRCDLCLIPMRFHTKKV
ncbi:hypothetical protein AAZV13_18G147400 [Glycine max]